MPQLDPNEYERATAIVAHETIIRSIAHSFPNLSMGERYAMFVAIMDRLARMQGWTLRREYADAEEGE